MNVTPSVSADPMARRDAALSILDRFRRDLRRASTIGHAQWAADQATYRLETVQGDPRDRRYLAKSLCWVASLLRKAGWAPVAITVLQRADRQQALDECSFCEFAECYLAIGDSETALGLLLRGCAEQPTSQGIYTTLSKMYLIRGDHERSRIAAKGLVPRF